MAAHRRKLKGALLRNPQVLAYPSLEEGFGLPILEAQSAGQREIIAQANVELLAEVGGSAAMLTDPYNVTGLAHVLEDAIDARSSSDLIDAGIENAAQYEWSKTTLEMIQVYERITG